MNADFYDSSTLSLVLSWLFSLPIFWWLISGLVSAFKKHDEYPWLYSAWVSICFLWFSPIRYLAFLLVMSVSYPFQSIHAFFSVFWVWPWFLAAIAFALLSAVGFVAPLAATLWTAGLGRVGLFVSAIIAPFAAYLASILFFLVLPFAGISAYTLDSDALIRATNGPARVAFLANGHGMIALPPYYSQTPETYTDMVRSHVALMYLSKSNHDRFLKIEYPYLYSEFHNSVSSN